LLDWIYTGQLSQATIENGTCAEIATGAPVPAGADAVVMVEETAKHGDHEIDIFAAATTGQNIGKRGGDMTIGDPVVSSGEVLTPSRVGALAAVGCAEVEVFVRPRVAILSTGNEVVAPGAPLPPGHIYDVNRFTLAAIVSAHGGAPEAKQPAHDTVDALVASLDACAQADLIVFSGGSSVGTRDLVVDAIGARGEMIFHGIAVRPGKPTAFATVGGTPRFCARWRGCRRTHHVPSTRRSAGESHRPPSTAISSIPCACATASPTPPSRARATSPACRRRMATSKSPPTRASSKKARR
jgi:molybdenum cofactor synthesis domain-containing protein